MFSYWACVWKVTVAATGIALAPMSETIRMRIGLLTSAELT